LWTDPELDHRRQEKSAHALIAVRRAVEEDAGLEGAAEFLEFYATVAKADSADFTTLWQDPAAYHWVRRAVHLLAARRGAPPPAWESTYSTALGARDATQALALHLRQFAKFVLGLGIVAHQDVRFATPYETILPLSVPATPLTLIGDGRIGIHGLLDGAVEITDGGGRRRFFPGAASSSSGNYAQTCPVVTIGEACVMLKPHLFHLPGLALFGELNTQTLAFQERHTQVVAEALEILARLHPLSFSHLARSIRIIALKPAREHDFGTFSTSELPGAFICSAPSDPFALAADFIHELHHNRLFAIEESVPLFEPGAADPIEGDHYYSPWRDAPRPLHGLLHALYVYLPVFRFWSAALREGALGGALLGYARDQLARIPFQLRIGVNQLRRYARFTASASVLFEEMAREAAEIEEEAAALGATLDIGAVACRASGALRSVVDERDGRVLSVGETLHQHLSKWDLHGQCAAEKALLERPVRRAFEANSV